MLAYGQQSRGTPSLRVVREEDVAASSSTRAILLSSYASGATEGRRLGTAGYSYDFVAKLFAPLFRRLGKLTEIQDPRSDLAQAAEAARRQGFDPVHVSFRPFQDAELSPSVRNVVVPAWEFPDIPDAAFDGNPQNDWVATANRCAMVWVGGSFTARALESAGVRTPIRIVAVPTPECYFDMPRWRSERRTALNCSPYVFPQQDAQTFETPQGSAGEPSRCWRETARVWGLRGYRRLVKPCLPGRLRTAVGAALRAGLAAWRHGTFACRRDRWLDLDGIVYTSIFNPADGRKNWQDMITAFLCALRDCEDATLVIKLASSDPAAVGQVVQFYRHLDYSHRCRVAIVSDFLAEADMLELARASTYYLTTTRAEGNCLPLMNYLAAGRPGISPSHSAIADYFDADVGFVVESHPEPCAWPQDSRLRWRSTWHRLVWTSLVEQIRRSYRIAKEDRAAYDALASAARQRMQKVSHPDVVSRQLRSALAELDSCDDPSSETEEPRAILPIRGDAGDDNATPVPSDKPAVCFDRSENASDGRILAFRRDAAKQVADRSEGEDRTVHASCTILKLHERPAARVVISLLNFRPGKIGGTETYLRQLVARLPDAGRRHEIVLLMDRDLASQNVFPGMERAVVDYSARQIFGMRGLEAVGPYRARGVEKVLESLRPDVVLFPQQSIFPKVVEAPCALVVHDLYHLVLPQYLTPMQRMFRQRSYAYAMARADRIIAISQFTKNTILNHYDIAADRIDVVPHGWEFGAFEACEADALPDQKYVYFPAITRPHKNHRTLLESIAALKSKGRFDYQLVLSGIQTAYWKNLQKQIHRLGLDDTVRHLGYVSYQRVRQLYRGAQCVVFPSSFEGFGLPVMEAFEAGKKILVSRLEIFRELGIPSRFQIDFSDPDQLDRALREPGVTLLTKRPWSWNESAAATIAALDRTARLELQPAEWPLARAA
ncbi:MAG: glycosyltransferase [Thermoguttaceae bacterium]